MKKFARAAGTNFNYEGFFTIASESEKHTDSGEIRLPTKMVRLSNIVLLPRATQRCSIGDLVPHTIGVIRLSIPSSGRLTTTKNQCVLIRTGNCAVHS